MAFGRGKFMSEDDSPRAIGDAKCGKILLHKGQLAFPRLIRLIMLIVLQLFHLFTVHSGRWWLGKKGQVFWYSEMKTKSKRRRRRIKLFMRFPCRARSNHSMKHIRHDCCVVFCMLCYIYTNNTLSRGQPLKAKRSICPFLYIHSSRNLISCRRILFMSLATFSVRGSGAEASPS